MTKHRTAVLMAFTFLQLVTRPATAADGITLVRDAEGRVVYVNDSSSPTNTLNASTNAASGSISMDGRQVKYVYWSNTQHRWKAVPAPSLTGNPARSAPAEVFPAPDPAPAAPNR